MSKFIFLYIGPQITTEDTSRPLTRVALERWEQSIGTALVGKGLLVGQNGKGVVDTGAIEAAPFPLYGFSIVQTETMEDAVNLAKGHPLLAVGNQGFYEVQIMELFSEDIPTEALARPVNLSAVQSDTAALTPTPASSTIEETLPPTTPGATVPPQPATVLPPQPTDTGPVLPPPTSTPGELTVPHDSSEDNK